MKRPGSGWTIAGGRFELEVEVPPNTKATVRLPKAPLAGVSEGGRALVDVDGVTGRRQEGETAVIEVGSGRYRFGYAWAPEP